LRAAVVKLFGLPESAAAPCLAPWINRPPNLSCAIRGHLIHSLAASLPPTVLPVGANNKTKIKSELRDHPDLLQV